MIKYFLTGLTFVLSLVIGGATVTADVNDFVIDNFHSEQWLDNSDKQGRLRIVETIDLTFTDNNHGILRAIPQKYQGNSLKVRINKISSTTGAPTEYTTYESNDNLVAQIGSPDRTLTGKQQYVIDYEVQNVVTFYDNHDELYWDINGDQWGQRFTGVSLTLHLPAGLTLKDQRCFAGQYGGTSQGGCQINAAGDTITASAIELAPNQTLTTVESFEKGYFAAATWQGWVRENLYAIGSVAIPPLLIGAWAFRRWWRDGKDLRGRGVIVPEYDAPNTLSAAELATIYNYKLAPKDVSATIVDLAIRKYIRIVETKEVKMLAPDTKTYEFHLLNADFAPLRSHEADLLKALYPEPAIGQIVKIKDLKNKFYKTVAQLQSDLPKSLTTAGYFYKNPTSAGGGLYAAGFGLLFLGFFLHVWLGLGLILAALLLLLFGSFMAKRTALGVATLEHAKGLKLYLDTAEKDRINLLQSPDAPYAPADSEPTKTVELFEKLLPFAIVLGVEKNWAKQFEDIYKTPPDWYTGNWTAFNTGLLVGSLNNSMTAMNTSFSPPSSSGSSGFFGGGGFSGGGGGGGGGGGW